jgi:HK97 family phage prohead protease
MTITRFTRAFTADLEVRSTFGGGRTVAGLVAPFNTAAPIADELGRYIETIAPGAFARTIAERGVARVKLLALHDRTVMPVGRATVLREEAAGLYGEFAIAQTERGDEAIALIGNGAIDAFSIGFRAIRDRWNRQRSERTLLEVRLDEVSLVWQPAYETARITALRQETTPTLHAAYERLLTLKR